ncbi:MAG: MFS transporter [Clostridia bacterium]
MSHRAPILSLYAANAISRVGDVLMLLALPWFVLQTTGSVGLTGLVAAVEAAGVAVTGISGALLVDRLGAKWSSVLSDAASGVIVLAVPALYELHRLPFPLLLGLVFLAGACATPGSIARQALVPGLAERARANLDRVNTVIDGVSRVGTLVGAPLAGLLIVLIGTTNLFTLDGISFLASAVMIGVFVNGMQRPDPEASTLRESLAHLREGLAFIRREPLIRSLMLVIMTTNLLDGGLYAVLAPAYIRATYHSAILFGELSGALGLGAVVGTILYGLWGYRLPRRATFAAGYIAAGAPRFWAIVFLPFPPLMLLATALVSTGIGPVNPALHTTLYQVVEPRLQPRVFGALTTGVTIGTPIGALLAGALATVWSPWGAIVIFSGLYLAATASLVVNPALRSMARVDERSALGVS